jgi:hypothetical protein
MNEEKQLSDLEAALAAIEQDKQARIQEANTAIQSVLQRFRVELIATPQLTADGRVVAVAQLIAR